MTPAAADLIEDSMAEPTKASKVKTGRRAADSSDEDDNEPDNDGPTPPATSSKKDRSLTAVNKKFLTPFASLFEIA